MVGSNVVDTIVARARIAMPCLTDDVAANAPAPARGKAYTWDSDADGRVGSATKGFALRITSGGAKTWVLRYRTTDDGIQREHKIGRWPKLRAEPARKGAEQRAKEIAQGGDPQGQRVAARKAAKLEREGAVLVDALIVRFMEEHVSKRRASTQDGYRRIIQGHIQPAIGHMQVRKVTEADIEAIHRKITKAGHKHQANRVVAIMSKMFGLALRWRMRTDGVNPCKGIERHFEGHRERYLTTDEANRLLAELDRHHDARSADAIRLLMLTGARRSEVLGMSWGDLDLDDKKTWTRRAENSKGKRASTVPLSPPATELLLAIRAEQIRNRPVLGEFVFPSAASKSRHLVEIKKFWRQVTKAAGLTDIRVHDLRHSFASILVSKGASLPLIGSLLAHRSVASTARYAHLALDAQRAAVDMVGETYAPSREAPQPPLPPAPVLPFIKPRGKKIS
jgi:integrase